MTFSQSEPPKVSPFSLKTMRLQLLDDEGKSLKQASGFLLLHWDELWLVTNYHAVSGRHHKTGDWLEGMSHTRWPMKLRMEVPTADEIGQDGLVDGRFPHYIEFDLY